MSELIPKSAEIPDSDYVIFGGTGDLALRKIFPALFWRYAAGQINQNFRLIAASRGVMPITEFSERLRPFCQDAIDQHSIDEPQWQTFIDLITIISLDVKSGQGMDDLAALVSPKLSPERPLIFYLAIAPSLFGAACQNLKKFDLALPQARLVVEKPLGHDGASASAINAELRNVFDESAIYRIDHYLGKETVQNLMALRFANVIFESQWGNHAIDNVQITVAESIGVEGRANYYDQYGALRDMVQNHLMQLVCLVAMEPPSQFNADQVRDEKLRVLRAIRPVGNDNIVRGQYTKGKIDGEMLPGYIEEVGEDTNTETYVALKLMIDNWRWAGVPFYVRTGKRMRSRASEIVVTFKPHPHDIFTSGPGLSTDHHDNPNRLIIRLQPEEGLRLQMTAKQPGPGGMRLSPSELNLDFGDAFDERLPDAYERLLMDVARGNQTLFMRLDEVLAAWDIIDPLIGVGEPQSYEAGSMGPVNAEAMLARIGHSWIGKF
ncbi:glucose-6-phosphate dehydrogenase [Alphaproteobacteria bacterium]|nr:glucose-6-phosphate dehydrogenase [Alphaproteobacteria bacterium]